MVLPSQAARPNTFAGRRFTTSRRRRSRLAPRLLILAGGVLVIGLTVWLWPEGAKGPVGPDPNALGDSLASAATSSDNARAPLIPPLTEKGSPPQVVEEQKSAPDKPPEEKVEPTIAASPAPTITMGVPGGGEERNALADNAREKPGAGQPANDAAPRQPPPQPPVRATVIQAMIDQASGLRASRPLEARNMLNRALHDPRASQAERTTARMRLAELNAQLVFSSHVAPGDPLTASYTIEPGDALARIASKQNTRVDWRAIQRINGLADPGRIRAGQKIKLLKGPFHAVVHKSAYRLDLYAGATDDAGNRLYIRSFPVGLGEYGSTPVGSWAVRPDSKLVNPAWANPRTGERFGADDPQNPIGERWIGLDGTDENTRLLAGYGIHGTIEPESIGHDASMGCVRMLGPDVEVLYELLIERESTVEIRP